MSTSNRLDLLKTSLKYKR